MQIRSIFGLPPREFLKVFVGICVGVATLIVAILLLIRRKRQREEERIQRLIHHRKPKIKSGPQKLLDHSKELAKDIVTTCNGKVHSAIGYGLANTILIEGKKSCVLLDTLETTECMRVALSALGEVVNFDKKPVVAVVITHAHRDHAGGTQFVLRRFPSAKVYAQVGLISSEHRVSARLHGFAFRRASKQFGTFLRPNAGERVNAGIGGGYNFETFAPVLPHETVSDLLTLTPEPGLTLDLRHAPGESDDQLCIFWREEKALFPADNVYRAFPNLYAIRGETRNLEEWVSTLDMFLSLSPSFLVPHHTRPVEGKEQIRKTLMSYRDGIQFVHDQTIRLMNKGLTGSDLGCHLKLPPTLRDHPFLQEFYGTVEWSARAVHNQYNGWFSGKLSDLRLQMSTEERAEKIVALKGEKKMLEDVEQILDAKKKRGRDDLRWVLHLIEAIIDSGCKTGQTQKIKDLKALCLRRLATFETSANGRNLLFTTALEVDTGRPFAPTPDNVLNSIDRLSIVNLFWMLPLLLDAQKAEEEEAEETARFTFTDTGDQITLKLRGPIMDFSHTTTSNNNSEENKSDLTVDVVTTVSVWKSILKKERNPLRLWMEGSLKVTTGIRSLGRFMAYIDQRV